MTQAQVKEYNETVTRLRCQLLQAETEFAALVGLLENEITKGLAKPSSLLAAFKEHLSNIRRAKKDVGCHSVSFAVENANTLNCLLCSKYTDTDYGRMLKHAELVHGYTREYYDPMPKRTTERGIVYTFADGKDWMELILGGNL